MTYAVWRKWEEMKSRSVAKNSLVVYCATNGSSLLEDCEADYIAHAMKMRRFAKRHGLMDAYNSFFGIVE